MASRLQLSRAFLDSTYVPEISLLSGKPTGGARTPMKLKAAPGSAREIPGLGSVRGGAGLAAGRVQQSRMSRTAPVPIPAAPGDAAKQALTSKIWVLPVILLPVLGVFVGMGLDTQHAGNLPGYVGGGAAAVGIVVGLIVKKITAEKLVELRILDDYGTIDVRLPTTLRAVFDAYKAAQQAFEAQQ